VPDRAARSARQPGSLQLHRDPRLRQAVEGWRFLKFRHLRHLVESPALSQASWTTLALDP
jgi:hypothetical protein